MLKPMAASLILIGALLGPGVPALAQVCNDVEVEVIPVEMTVQHDRLQFKSTYPHLWGDDTEALNHQLTEWVSDSLDAAVTLSSQLEGRRDSSQSFQKVTHTSQYLGLVMTTSEYLEGAAHPSHSVYTLNINLCTRKPLELADLFVADRPYLEMLARKARPLVAEAIGADMIFGEGFEPVAANFANWTLTPQGLQLTFGEYQVGPYAVGMPSVTIPYAELAGWLKPETEALLRQD